MGGLVIDSSCWCRTIPLFYRSEFYQDARTVACLKNVNIVGLLGMCCQEEPLYAVLEYMKHGDLRQFLQARVAAESSLGCTMNATSHRKTLRYIYHLCRQTQPNCETH